MSELKAYTEEELAEHQQLYDEVFTPVWESEGQYCRAGGGQYEKSFAWWAFKHQQSKIDELRKISVDLNTETIRQREQVAYYLSKNAELQKQNAWLSGVAERENKRANKLQEEEVSTTSLLGKTIQEKNELTKQRDSFIKAYEIEMDKSDDLQKRLDAALQLVNEMKGKRYPFSAYADQLEQALKGDSNG